MGRLMSRCTLAATVLLFAAGASARDARDHEDARMLREAGAIVPLEQIVRAATAHRPGRVVEVELERHDGAYTYEIEMLGVAGDVWELKYDARTGALLREEAER